MENFFLFLKDDLDKQIPQLKEILTIKSFDTLSLRPEVSLLQILDINTLFYIFYYFPGTPIQFLAATELKERSWRFHKKFSTWFQRYSQPSVVTKEHETGSYIYFDFENSWCQRRKNEFKFEYKFLDD